MPMPSLRDRITKLESDLICHPMRISVIHDLPFAIFRYDPNEEWLLRREVRSLQVRLEQKDKSIKVISFEDLLWTGIDEIEKKNQGEGYQALVDLERKRGFLDAQDVIIDYLSDEDWFPLTEQILDRMKVCDPAKDIVFLVHAPAMAPDLYPMSRLLDELHGRTRIPAILFYPGSIEGATGLRFMDMRNRQTTGNYRVKIY